jgi:hypothetical protein
MYMNQNEFALAGGIQELSFNEIDEIAGGPLPAAVIACAANPGCVAAVGLAASAVGVATAAAIDYFF